jgi:hypothetical protein
MPTLEGSQPAESGGPAVRFRVDYEVVGNVVNYRASFDAAGGPSRHEGQFDFDPARVDAEAAVLAFMQNHIGKADWDIAP